MGQFFEYNPNFKPWTKDNFLIFIFLAYNISLLIGIIYEFPTRFHYEKYWQTLPALIIGSFNRYILLLGILFSKLALISIPITIIFIISYIYYPITFFTFLLILAIHFFISLIFAGIGLILGIFAISKENFLGILRLILNIFFWFSCISFPYQIFPPILQEIINLNPLYHVFFLLRISWIENSPLITFSLHFRNFIVLIISAIFFPFIGVFIFNKIYNKYGIVGY
ncbi:MAG: ABC transporter permease [Promethearchaeota archaeon]